MINPGKLRKKFFLGVSKKSYGNKSQPVATDSFIRCERLKQSGSDRESEAGESEASKKVYRARYDSRIKFGTILIDADKPSDVYEVINVDDLHDRRRAILITLELKTK